MAAAAAALHQRCFTPGWNDAAFQDLLTTRGGYLFATGPDDDNNRLTGLLLARSAAGEGEILTLCVDPDRRGQGLGRQLVHKMLADLGRDGTHEFFLEVAQCNHTAQGLYQRCGFSIIGVRKAYYADGRSAVIMRHADKV